MAHVPERWFGIVLRIVREYYPEAELAVWGSFAEGDTPASTDDRLELVIVEPREVAGDVLHQIRRRLERSDLPVPADVRELHDLTMNEQNEVLERGIRFGG